MNKKEMVKAVKKAIKDNDLKLHHNLTHLMKFLDPKAKQKILAKLWLHETMTPSIFIGNFFRIVFDVKL